MGADSAPPLTFLTTRPHRRPTDRRYLLYWNAFEIAMGPPRADPDYPQLAELMDPDALAEVKQQVQESRDNGEILVNPPESPTAPAPSGSK